MDVLPLSMDYAVLTIKASTKCNCYQLDKLLIYVHDAHALSVLTQLLETFKHSKLVKLTDFFNKIQPNVFPFTRFFQ